MFNMYSPPPFFLSVAPAAEGAFLTTDTSSANSTTYTFSSLTFGTAAADRYIVACFTTRGGGSNADIDSVTIGGVTATEVINATALQATVWNGTAIFIAAVPSGTSGDVVVTYNVSTLRCGCSLYRLTGLGSATAHDTASDTTFSGGELTDTIDVPAGGIVIAASGQDSGTTPGYTWTGVTEEYDEAVEANFDHSGGIETGLAVETGRTITAAIAGSPAAQTMAAASFS